MNNEVCRLDLWWQVTECITNDVFYGVLCDTNNMQMGKEQPTVLTEEHFARAAKRTYSRKLSDDIIQVIKKELVGLCPLKN